MGFYGFDPFPVLGDMRYVFRGCVRKMGALLPRTFHHANLLSERNEKRPWDHGANAKPKLSPGNMHPVYIK